MKRSLKQIAGLGGGYRRISHMTVKVLTVIDKGKNVFTRDHYDRNKPRGSITRPYVSVLGDTVTRGLFYITMEPPIVLCRHMLVLEATCAGNKKHSAFWGKTRFVPKILRYSLQHRTDQDRANIIFLNKGFIGS